ncbi:hypothetical protein G5C65_25885 [Streptomyces sp. SB3404]|uniref:Uncharacterized protein n=2 Tax=Streptomyces boncukensis TaxID=2711219 RepID=A0A6G4X2F0_9ACTN|nr:hypothetical protein [Streptomyces boncukensis]
MTVEIVFALVTAAVLAVALGSALLLGVSGTARQSTLTYGALVGAVAGMWRLVRALRRFDAQRRADRGGPGPAR